MNRFSDRRISQKKLFGFRIWRIFYTDLRILSIQRIADLSNILAQIVDLACNLVRILDCDFIADFASNLGGSADLYTHIHPPPPLSKNSDDSDIISNMNRPRYICNKIISKQRPLSMSYIITFRYTHSE